MRRVLLLATAFAIACADTHTGDVIGADPAPDAGDHSVSSAGSGGGSSGASGGGGNAGNSGKPDPPNATLDGEPPPACDHVRATAPDEIYCQHASCTDGENGRCDRRGNTAYCTYDECFASGDCRTGGPCSCSTYDEAANHCMPGNCVYDQDCAGSLRCSPSYGACGPPLGGYDGYYCHTPDDLCSDDDDCGPGEHCTHEPAAGHWLCLNVTCVG